MVPLVFLSDVHAPDRVKPMNSGARIKDKSPPLTSGIHIKPDDSVAEVLIGLCPSAVPPGKRGTFSWGKVVKSHEVAFSIVVRKESVTPLAMLMP